jgi:Mg2+ and Co2+ transporter CorA
MLKKFFWMCSGADTDLLEKCSKAEQIKFAGIGGTVFFTAVMASIAASYALFTVFDNLLTAIIFGLIWGLLIFNLDRFIVSTIKKNDNKWKELAQAVPRILLAIIIAVVISKPLELKLFEKEVDRVLLEQKNDLTLANQLQIADQYSPEIESLKQEIDALQLQIDTKEAETNALYDTYIAEAEGREGTMLIGKGPVYKEKREKHDAALAELQTVKTQNRQKISDRESQIAALQLEQKEQVKTTQPVIDGFDGLMARINALGALPWLPSFFIFLLFLAVETSPIFAKLVSPKGEYDHKLEDIENAVQTWVSQKVNQRENIFETDMAMNTAIYNELADEEELYRYKRQKAREIMQMQADAFHKSQKNIVS